MLFYEPKLLKVTIPDYSYTPPEGFSALLRAEIVETHPADGLPRGIRGFSALLRAEIVESRVGARCHRGRERVSVLFYEPKLLKLRMLKQCVRLWKVSVLFYEPKLLKLRQVRYGRMPFLRFSALLRAEIVESDYL